VVPDYHETKTKEGEQAGIALLRTLGLAVEANNETRITEIDYVTSQGEAIDFQYSQDFGKWGDIRIDLISAYLNKSAELKNIPMDQAVKKLHVLCQRGATANYLTIFDYLAQWIDIRKEGKYFESEQLKGVLYFFYDKEKNGKPRLIVAVSKSNILDYVAGNWEQLVATGKVKFNYKSHLKDSHGSAFLALPASFLETYMKAEIINPACFLSALAVKTS